MLKLLFVLVALSSAKSLSTSIDLKSDSLSQGATQHTLHLKNVKRDAGGSVYVKFVIFTDSPIECKYGLTYDGVFVKMDYRLLEQESPGQWISLKNFVLEPASKSR